MDEGQFQAVLNHLRDVYVISETGDLTLPGGVSLNDEIFKLIERLDTRIANELRNGRL
jgi:hypothetical protein